MASDLDELIVTLSKTLGLTVVIVSHELESIFRVADRVVMLDKEAKTIIATGEPKALKTSEDPRVRAFFNRGKKEG
jgi:phospholipid/cholesterol/gamma-HCH transport system ATP-binding protein